MTQIKESIQPSQLQQEAIDAVVDWFHNDDEKQCFFLAGYAGTGKSTIVELILEQLEFEKDKRPVFACYTGKAALVLTQKTGRKVKTLHKLLYSPEFLKGGGVEFVRKAGKDMKHVGLAVIDEWSMVDGEIYEDLISFGFKVLCVGDTGQLPPVQKVANEELEYMLKNPDFLLTEIHRQAADNPIIYLSWLARTKQTIPYGWHGKNKEVLVVNQQQWNQIKEKCYRTADQIICGKNVTRNRLNQEIRKTLDFSGTFPKPGEKLICTRNNWERELEGVNLVNGMIGYVETVDEKHGDKKHKLGSFKMDFRPEFLDSFFEDVFVVKEKFKGNYVKLWREQYKMYDDFEFGYAITCHKSQGSQWENLVVIAERMNWETYHLWLYTAITRAEKRLILVI